MILTELRLSQTNQAMNGHFKIQPGTDLKRHFIALYDPRWDHSCWSESLRYLCQGTNHMSFDQVQWHLCDPDGQIWRLARQAPGHELQIWQGQSRASSMAFHNTMELTLTELEPHSWLQTMKIQATSSGLKARLQAPPQAQSQTISAWEQTLHSKVAALQAAFPEWGHLNEHSLILLTQEFLPTLSQYLPVLDILKDAQTFLPKPKHPIEYRQYLNHQVELLTEISQQLKAILNPDRSLPKLIKRQQEITTTLKEIAEKPGLQLTRIPAAKIPWSEVIDTFSHYQAYGMLYKAFDKAETKYTQEIITVFHSHSQRIANYLKADQAIAQEIQRCIDYLTTAYEQAPKPTATNSHSSSWSSKLKPFGSKSQPAPQQHHQLQEALIFDRSRQTTDKLIESLGKLRAQFQTAQLEQDTNSKAFDNLGEKVRSEYNRLHTTWQKSAQKYGINHKIDLPQILELLHNSALISALESERKILNQEIHSHHQNLEELRNNILKWRHITASTKETPLTTPQELIKSAKALIENLPAKQNHLKKIADDELQRQAYAINQKLWGKKLAQLSHTWQATMTKYRCPQLSLSDPRLQEHLSTLQLIQSQSSQKSKEPNTALEELISDSVLSTPFTIASWEYHTNKELKELEAIIKASDITNIFILACTTQKAFESLKALGMSHCIRQTQTQQPPKAESSQQQILSDRAKKALELFRPPSDIL